MRSPSFSRSVESRTTMNSPFPVTPGLFVSKNSVECSPSPPPAAIPSPKPFARSNSSPSLSLSLSPSLPLSHNSMAMKITYGRPQLPPGSSGKWDLSPQVKPFRFLIVCCSRLVVVVAVVVVDMEEYMVLVRKKSLVFFFLFFLLPLCSRYVTSQFNPSDHEPKNKPRTEQ